MYSRRTGILQTSSDGIKKIESFNQNLREQYNSRNTQLNITPKSNNSIKNNNEFTNKLYSLFGSEEVILVALILLLAFDINRDYLLIGVLAILLLLN